MTLRLNGATSGYTELDAPDVAGNNNIKLPASNGSANQFLKNSGTAGTLSWSSVVEDSSGRLLVGTSTGNGLFNGGTQSPQFQIEGTTGNTILASLTANRNDAAGPTFYLAHSRGTATGGTTALQSGDQCGVISFAGTDGTDYAAAATIAANVDGAVSGNVMPGRLVFSTNDGTASAAPTARMTIKADGAVGIGLDSPGKTLTVLGDIWSGTGAGSGSPGVARSLSIAVNRTAGSDVFPSIALYKGYTSSSATVGGFKIEQSGTHLAPALTFSYGTSVGNTASTFVEPSWTEGLRITSDGTLRLINSPGIDFSQIQTNAPGMTSELLDSYEEGTFTPTIVGTSTSGTGTYTTQVGRYTKIGNSVFFTITLAWSAHTGTGGMKVGGLPFTSDSTAGNTPPTAISSNNLTLPANSYLTSLIAQNSTEIILYSMATGGGALAALAIDTSATIYLAGRYNV